MDHQYWFQMGADAGVEIERRRCEKLVAAERERCAKIAERYERKCGSVNGRKAALDIASEIRQSESQ